MHKMEKFTHLDDVLKTAWNLLYRAAVSRNDPMRTPVLATVMEGQPHQRTIVLRKVDTVQNQLYFFSDLRAPKVTQLRQNPSCNVLFWDPRKKVQIEAQAIGQIFHQAPINEAFWKQINVGGRTSYAATQSPGTPIEKGQTYLPAAWNTEMDIKDTESAYSHFAVLELTVQQLDVLHLHQAGHQRCLFKKMSTGDWQKDWVVP